MFSFTKTFTTVVLGATSVLSLTLNAPSSPQSGTNTTITWTSTSTDPTFSLELFHPSFNQAIAIANNVDPSLNQITVELPLVPAGDQYTLEAVNITNINQVFSNSSDFSIAAAPSTAIPSSTAGVSTPASGGSSTAVGAPTVSGNPNSAATPSA
ncbi:hypothetical protein C8R44DRAFT_823929 [Mycena epipterygia]|nr:hypothetical protein C8R44DRAFT_823929 [Mycena epipterygia]